MIGWNSLRKKLLHRNRQKRFVRQRDGSISRVDSYLACLIEVGNPNIHLNYAFYQSRSITAIEYFKSDRGAVYAN